MLTKKVKFILLAITCVWVTLSPNIVNGQADVIYEKNNAAVVTIIIYDTLQKPVGIGSGFIVHENGYIITNFHVIGKQEPDYQKALTIVFPNYNAIDFNKLPPKVISEKYNEWQEVAKKNPKWSLLPAALIKVKYGDALLNVEGVVLTDSENDLALIKVHGTDFPKIQWGDSDNVKPGEKVYVIGSPYGYEKTISDGIISGIRGQKRELQITAPISPGSSGGPVFDSEGRVIGVATYLRKDAQNLNFAMPISLIDKMLKSVSTNKPQSNPTVTNDVENKEEPTKKQEEADSYYNIACSMIKNFDRYEQAIENIKKCFSAMPNDAANCYNIATFYGDKVEDYEEALKYCRRALSIASDFPLAQNYFKKLCKILNIIPKDLEIQTLYVRDFIARVRIEKYFKEQLIIETYWYKKGDTIGKKKSSTDYIIEDVELLKPEQNKNEAKKTATEKKYKVTYRNIKTKELVIQTCEEYR
jgi:tetratricopeptide (TPR) repeat protein